MGLLFAYAIAALLIAAPTDEDEPGSARVPVHTSSVATSKTSSIADARSDEAWWLYDDAFVALAGENFRLARDLLNRLIRLYPQHPAAEQARIVRLRLTGEPEHGGPNADNFALPPGAEFHQPLPPRPRDPINQWAYAELIVGQSIAQSVLAVTFCAALSCNELGTFLSATIGTLSGLSSAIFFARDGISSSHAAALNSGPVWGMAGGALVYVLINPKNGDTQVGAGLAVGAGALSLALAEGAWAAFQPSSGDLSLFNSGAAWSAVLAYLIAGVAAPHGDFPAAAVLLAGAGGATASALLATRLELSRPQVLVADAGGVLGLGLGALIGTGLRAQGRDGAILSSTLLGLATGAVIATFWVDGPELFPVEPIVSVAEGRTTLSFAGRF